MIDKTDIKDIRTNNDKGQPHGYLEAYIYFVDGIKGNTKLYRKGYYINGKLTNYEEFYWNINVNFFEVKFHL